MIMSHMAVVAGIVVPLAEGVHSIFAVDCEHEKHASMEIDFVRSPFCAMCSVF